MDLDQEVYTPKEVAEKFKIKKETVQKYIRQGKIEAFKVGREYRVTEEALQKYVEEHRT